MKPEKGDKQIRVTHKEVVTGVKAAGVRFGDIVFFHSSLSSMGMVVGGADTVIDGFLSVVGPEGTVAVPTLCQKDSEKRFETWDKSRSLSDVGLITEVFRLKPEAHRSDHPTHSVAAIGARAKELVQEHANAHGRVSPWGDAAFAPGSPWEKLYLWNASYMFIGVNFAVCTMKHYIESLFVERALATVHPQKKAKLQSRVQGWLKPGVWPSYNSTMMEEYFHARELMNYSEIGSATVRHIKSSDLVDTALEILQTETNRWFNQEFIKWYQEFVVAQSNN